MSDTMTTTTSTEEERHQTVHAMLGLAGGKERMRVRVYLDGGTSGATSYTAEWLVRTLVAGVAGDAELHWDNQGLNLAYDGQRVHIAGLIRPAGE